jgi:Fe-Mn family superoxide dismutase
VLAGNDIRHSQEFCDMKIRFAELPYRTDALEPHYSEEMLKLHYQKHHRAYFDKTVELIQGTELEDKTLEEIIKAAAKDRKSNPVLFNDSAQIWNHDLFWRSMTSEGGGEPDGQLMEQVDRDFGGYSELRQTLKDEAVKLFGSGWTWLVFDGGKLKVTSTQNAENPLVTGGKALLALDVWEHAYYVDYQNRRPEFVDAYLENLVNWRHAAELFDQARRAGETGARRAAGGRSRS